MDKKIDEEFRDSEYFQEYVKLLKKLARIAVNYPEKIDALRDMMKITANLMISNCPEVVKEFHELIEEMDSFLVACQRGEIDAKKFTESDIIEEVLDSKK
jgi:hypothetical protein